MVFNESRIEQALINKLINLKYTYRSDIRDKAALEANFREKFEALNKVCLTDSEFTRLLNSITTADVFAAAKALREQNTFIREDGTALHYTLVNIKDWCKNDFEVVNQLRINTSASHHRYDVILLINGLSVVQIELKTLQISPRNAMKQIVEYKNDPGNGYTNSLLCFMQLFIVSNESSTYYFANNNRQHFSFDAEEGFLPIYQFADKENQKITHLHDFSDKFLEKCTLARMIGRYMVLVASEQKLLVMRPYQIYAVKAIIDCIHENRGNGYIWHTTGSGKTLTSFKASTLLKDNPDIAKCLFVVDRKDLDRQTREEFNKFQEGCVEENTNTETLVERLLSEDYADKVIVTTIQKLGLALDENHKRQYQKRLEPLKNKRIAIIFDECHRSQFGENHQAIKTFFPNAQLFGFTGTPIFPENSTAKQIDGTEASYKTTQDIFQQELHAYTITNAIDDQNVLKFHIDYYKPDGENPPQAGSSVSKRAIVESILSKHDAATDSRRFNAVLATASINEAIEYWQLFQTIQAEQTARNPEFEPLNIACVFSPPAQILPKNDPKNRSDITQLQEGLQQEKLDNQTDPEGKKAALEAIIEHYNRQYRTNFHLGEFDQYYQDIQQRIKNQKYSRQDYPQHQRIDITIVVDMLLTGFDSKHLNTLYVDKNLKYHGLIQAFSRTNRILNDSKPYGNILDFRGQEAAVDEAVRLFSGKKDQERAKEIWLVDSAEIVIGQLQNAVADLENFMASQKLECTPSAVHNLKGDEARTAFIHLFKEVQRRRNQLDQYTDLNEEQQQTIEATLPETTRRAFKGVYIDIAGRLKESAQTNPILRQAIAEQIDFEFVLFSSALIDYDYIMRLIARYTSQSEKQRMTRAQLIELISSSANLSEERDDIIAYIDSIQTGIPLSEEQIRQGYRDFKAAKTHNEIEKTALKHGLAPAALQAFADRILNRMIFDGEQLTDLLAPLNLGWKQRSAKELELMTDLIPILKKRAEGREISGLSAYE